jgi:hypothetical protein
MSATQKIIDATPGARDKVNEIFGTGDIYAPGKQKEYKKYVDQITFEKNVADISKYFK